MKIELPIPNQETKNFIFVKQLERELRKWRGRGLGKITNIELTEVSVLLKLES